MDKKSKKNIPKKYDEQGREIVAENVKFCIEGSINLIEE
jgi:hypothetical protein